MVSRKEFLNNLLSANPDLFDIFECLETRTRLISIKMLGIILLPLKLDKARASISVFHHFTGVVITA